MARAYLVAGLGFGDEGKGSIVDYLCRTTSAKLVVRYNGGPQAAHNVVTPDGFHHTFAQFGSGTFAGAQTHLSKFMLIEPYAMMNEAEVLEGKGIEDPMNLISVDEECVIITPWHWLANRIKESARGALRHGSCGMGVGEARCGQLDGIFLQVRDVVNNRAEILLRNIKNVELLECIPLADVNRETSNYYKRMREITTQGVASDYSRWLKRGVSVYKHCPMLPASSDVIFEGAQGVLLDEKYGFAPRNTWTDCTFNNAENILNGFFMEKIKIGVLRAYMTRHGAGSFPTEDDRLLYADDHNKKGAWQGTFRLGHFDAALYQYALSCLVDVDYLALTHMDQVKTPWQYSDGYIGCTIDPDQRPLWSDAGLASKIPAYLEEKWSITERVEKLLNTKIRVISRGCTYLDKVGKLN